MAQINDGGPAFPLAYTETNEHGVQFPYTHPGMSIRDCFAGQALRARWGDGTAMTPEQAASMAYQLADAMLAERFKGGDHG